jgi:hypothetical protein
LNILDLRVGRYFEGDIEVKDFVTKGIRELLLFEIVG